MYIYTYIPCANAIFFKFSLHFLANFYFLQLGIFQLVIGFEFQC